MAQPNAARAVARGAATRINILKRNRNRPIRAAGRHEDFLARIHLTVAAHARGRRNTVMSRRVVPATSGLAAELSTVSHQQGPIFFLLLRSPSSVVLKGENFLFNFFLESFSAWRRLIAGIRRGLIPSAIHRER